MKLGIVIYSKDAETVWNAFRLGNYAQGEDDKVKVFLLAKGVECEALNTEAFDITEQMRSLTDGGGRIYACGTCLRMRHSEGSERCPISTMKDLYEMIKESDKVISF
jgi:uncharacterized protein involved in oxidation of intracellular sulfur